MNTKVVKIEDGRKPRAAAKPEQHLFQGFSDRLNNLIDRALPDAPRKARGRYAWLAAMMGVSKPASAMWLDEDRVPREETLDRMLELLLENFQGYRPPNGDRIKTWLLYGDDVIQDPFKTYSPDQQFLLPLALQLIGESVKAHKMKHTAYNFQKVVDATLEMLFARGITNRDEVQAQHMRMVARFLKDFV